MSDRPCSEWWHEPCVIAASQGGMSPWCVAVGSCMYALSFEDLEPQLREYYDAWSHGWVCMLWYRPAVGATGAQ